MPDAFHFLRPLWLLALIPLALMTWRVYMPGGGDNPWRRVVDARILPLLMVGRAEPSTSRLALFLLTCGWIVAVFALADPTWERKPQPVFQTTASRVIVLDLSSSMDTDDLKPSRLARARYKIEDILALGAEGQTGLVVYAGDAFTVSPLTRDANTIRALLKALDPSIMPVQGKRADLGLLKGAELLRQAGAPRGQVVLITDGVDARNTGASASAVAQLRREGYRTSVIGVVGADVTSPSPADAASSPNRSPGAVEPPDAAALQSLASAGGGEYQPVNARADALRSMVSDRPSMRSVDAVQSDATAQGWKEQGPLLAVLLLPIAALAFRRNWLLSVVVLIGFMSPPRPAMASAWDDLWQRQDQQAAKAFQSGDYAKAATLAADPTRRGSAEYKRGNYQAAQEAFAKASGPDADYNRGNALAQAKRYQEAVAAYDKSLQQNPNNDDARANKAAVEALLKQQPPQQQANKDQDESKKNDDSKDKSPQGDAKDQASKDTKDDKEKKSDSSSDKAPQSAKDGKSDDDSPKHDDANEKPTDGDNKRDASQKSDAQSATKPASENTKDSGSDFAEAAKKLAEPKADRGKKDAMPPVSAGPAAANPNAPEQAAKRAQGTADARPLDSEEQLAAEQWLRRIPDDPGGLLRRKFLYQYRQRTQRTDVDGN